MARRKQLRRVPNSRSRSSQDVVEALLRMSLQLWLGWCLPPQLRRWQCRRQLFTIAMSGRRPAHVRRCCKP